MSNELAELLFPYVKSIPKDIEKLFPNRGMKKNQMVTRLGPSPTGFIHLGNLYGAFVDERLAHQSGGIFYLRIEDTDQKRYVEGAAETIIDSLAFFGINFDEGVTKTGEIGKYGPYCQSARKEIYQVYVKDLVKAGLAYPCFMTEKEISLTREKQEKEKLTPGIYGDFAIYRNKSLDEIKELINSGKEYVIRLKSRGTAEEEAERIIVEDAIRGNLSMPSNFQDVVILKSDGMPTYHFAHVIDDHLMRTTHVIRGEEWLSTLPIHIELFEILGFEKPTYCHTAQLMKIDEEGKKRKLSKRLDPELSLDYYKKEGYHKDAVREYLLTILNSNYEEWRIENPLADATEFKFSLDKMSNSGTLFDINKLKDISKDCLLRISAADLSNFLIEWAEQYEPEIKEIICKDRKKLAKILDIGRKDKKPRKDLVYGKQILEHIGYFFPEYFKMQDELPTEVTADDAKVIFDKYLETYSQSDDQETWFGKIRAFAVELGYAAKPKDYKKNPDAYKGHVGHVSTVIRLALTGRSQSPDIWEIQQILGEEEVVNRLKNVSFN